MQSLLDAVSQVTFAKGSFLRSYFFCGCLCKKNKEHRGLTRTSSRFERLLDTRKIASVHTNLTLLLRVLLTDEQLFLFLQDRKRMVDLDKSETNSSDDGESNLQTAADKDI